MPANISEAARKRVIRCLIDIVTDTDQRAADRIAAAKLLIDREAREPHADGELTVVFKDVPPEYYG